jgi:hypothetical protein
MKNAVFRDVTPCGPCKNRRLGRTYRLHHQGDKNRRTRNVSSTEQLKPGSIPSQRASVASCFYRSSSPILVTFMMEATGSYETSVLTRATPHNIPEGDIRQRGEKLQ